MHVGVQPAEISHPGRGAHAAQKSIALDEQSARAGARGAGGGGNAGRPAAEHQHVGFIQQRRAPRGFGNELCLRSRHGWSGS